MKKQKLEEQKHSEEEVLDEKEDLPEEKIYVCKSCGTKYTQDEAERINFECCDEEVDNLESDPKHSEDDEI